MENNAFGKVMPRTDTQHKNTAEKCVAGKTWAKQEPITNST